MTCLKCGYSPDALVVRSWTLEIPREVESMNAHRANFGGGRFAYKRNRNAWQLALKVERINHRVPIATTRRRVTLTRLYGKGCRAFDLDNLAGGLKQVTDALVREGLISGDSPKHAEIHYDQIKTEGATGLRVLIEELAT